MSSTNRFANIASIGRRYIRFFKLELPAADSNAGGQCCEAAVSGITYVIPEVAGSEHFAFGFSGERAVFESDNRTYYERRAARATELGNRAKDPKIAAIHYELALRYAILSVGGGPRRSDVIALNKGCKGDSPRTAAGRFEGSGKPEVEQSLQHG